MNRPSNVATTMAGGRTDLATGFGRLGDALQDFAGQLRIPGFHADIPKGDDPDQLVSAVERHQTPDLLLLHELSSLLHVLVLEGVDELRSRGTRGWIRLSACHRQ